MSLRKKGMVEVATGTSALTLKAEAHESIRVTDIRYFTLAAGAEDFDISIDTKRIMQLKAPSGWYLGFSNPISNIVSILTSLKELGMFWPIPLASGQTLTVTAAGANKFVEVVYDLYDAGDVQANEPNGTLSNESMLYQVIGNSDTVTAAGDWPLDQSQLDSIFPAFPGGAKVPANHTMDLLALFGSPVTKAASGAQQQHTSRLKLVKNADDIADKDLGGYLFYGDQDYATNGTHYRTDASRLWVPKDGVRAGLIVFDEPIRFVGGDELNVNATVVESATAGDLTANEISLGMVFRVSRQGQF